MHELNQDDYLLTKREDVVRLLKGAVDIYGMVDVSSGTEEALGISRELWARSLDMFFGIHNSHAHGNYGQYYLESIILAHNDIRWAEARGLRFNKRMDRDIDTSGSKVITVLVLLSEAIVPRNNTQVKRHLLANLGDIYVLSKRDVKMLYNELHPRKTKDPNDGKIPAGGSGWLWAVCKGMTTEYYYKFYPANQAIKGLLPSIGGQIVSPLFIQSEQLLSLAYKGLSVDWMVVLHTYIERDRELQILNKTANQALVKDPMSALHTKYEFNFKQFTWILFMALPSMLSVDRLDDIIVGDWRSVWDDLDAKFGIDSKDDGNGSRSLEECCQDYNYEDLDLEGGIAKVLTMFEFFAETAKEILVGHDIPTGESGKEEFEKHNIPIGTPYDPCDPDPDKRRRESFKENPTPLPKWLKKSRSELTPAGENNAGENKKEEENTGGTSKEEV